MLPTQIIFNFKVNVNKKDLTDKDKSALDAETFKSIAEGYSLAAALLVHDLPRLAGLYILIIAPGVLGVVLETLDPGQQILLTFLERIFQVLFLYIVTRHWINTLAVDKKDFSPGLLLIFILYGVGFWLLFSVPAVLLLLNIPAEIKFVSVIMFVPAIYLGIRYYFYFFPVALGITSPSLVFSEAGSYTSKDWLLPVKAMLAPLGITVALVALAMIPSPDGRDLGFVALASAFEGIFWLLSCYLSIAFCLKLTTEKTWHEAGLDPYREARFATLEIRRPDWLFKALRPRSGFLWLGLGLLIWSAVMSNSARITPAVKISIEKIELEGKLVTLQMKLQDERFNFRGFRPFNFSLAGNTGTVVSTTPKSGWIAGHRDEEILFIFPSGLSETKMVLEFETDRNAEQLKALTDLYLWYRRAKLNYLDMSKAVIVGQDSTTPAKSDLPTGDEQGVQEKG